MFNEGIYIDNPQKDISINKKINSNYKKDCLECFLVNLFLVLIL